MGSRFISVYLRGDLDRRLFLSSIAGLALWPLTARAVPPLPGLRRLKLVNAHTGETFDGSYRDNNGPIPGVLKELYVFLRDFHSGAEIAIDVGVIDFLACVLDAAGETKATILSAYRTPETNAMLARTNFGVAENSQHIHGRALDFRLDSKLPEAMKAARAMERGGVGWYPHSGFIHIDTGPVRNWTLGERWLDDLLRSNSRPRRIDSKKTLPTGDVNRSVGMEEQHTARYRLVRTEFLSRLGIRLSQRQ
jgi:uncharacterized protein YcbK (DUF882 family)